MLNPVMMRARGLYGPMFQKWSKKRWIHSAGNRFSVARGPTFWDLTVDTTADNQSFAVNIAAGTTPKITVDWGDGTVETLTALGIKKHTYATAGRWRPKISGSFAAGGNIQLGEDTTDKPRLKAVAIVPTIPGLTNFELTFSGCTGLTAIPLDLFRYNPQVSASAFAFTFNSCTGLTAIPLDLFRYNTLVSANGFNRVFSNCSNITALPDAIFRYNTLVSSNGFNLSFIGCTALAAVSADLFRYTTLCTSFTSVFQNCHKLQLRADMFFPVGGETTRFLNQSVSFADAMRIGAFTGTKGTAPALWECSFGTGTPTPANCFLGQSAASVTNYASIPTAWGGTA